MPGTCCYCCCCWLLQFLQQNKWSLAACEQVLSNHQEARYKNYPQGRPAFDPVNK
jgi:hypothetical protein